MMLSGWTLGRDCGKNVLCPFIYTVSCRPARPHPYKLDRLNAGGLLRAARSGRADQGMIGPGLDFTMLSNPFELVWICLNSGIRISFQHAFESVWTRLNSFEFRYQISFHHAFESVWTCFNSGIGILFHHAFESVWTRLNSFWIQVSDL